jgi:methyltransferase (TIGR00027 family)
MDAERPSVTAERAAIRRAAHQLVDRPLVFEDPLALRILGAQTESEVRSDPEGSPAGRSRVLRAFLAARSRYAEDALAEAVSRGVRQYVVLGAGLDTFAYRNPHEGLRVFEVDRAATQEWKRRRLAEAEIGLPESLTFAHVDFERDTLGDALARAGFDAGRAAVFAWLGVTPYLSRDAVVATLRFAASASAGSEIIFDFALDPSSLEDERRQALERLAALVAAIGEPFMTFFDPGTLAAELVALGFGRADVVGPGDLDARYFRGRSDGLGLRGIGHLAHARL